MDGTVHVTVFDILWPLTPWPARPAFYELIEYMMIPQSNPTFSLPES